MIDIEIIKKRIINFIKREGPCLPIHISKEIDFSPMFASAILAELTNTKQVKTSSLKIGSSPLYYLPEQEQELEKFSDNLEGVEKEALLKLRKNKILDDKAQTPPIRVALRSIKDFAVSFRTGDKLFWKYNFLSEDETEKLINKIQKIKPDNKIPQTTEKIPTTPPTPATQKPLAPIFEKVQITPTTPTTIPHTIQKPKPVKAKKSNQNFLEEIKIFLQSKQIELISLEQFDKRKVIAIVRLNSQPHLLTAFNKKRITELELIKTYRKAAELNIPYYLIAKAEPTKKMQELSQAYKKLTKIDKLD